jgi:tetratricopeptide (TPR) repeat protein
VWVEAHVGKGKQLAQHGDWQGALQQFQHALEYPHHLAVGKPVHPADAIPLFWAGLAAQRLGQDERARDYWQEAVGCAAYSERDKAHQAVALELLGRREEAQQLAQVEGIAREMQQLREEIAATRAETTSFEGEAFHP